MFWCRCTIRKTCLTLNRICCLTPALATSRYAKSRFMWLICNAHILCVYHAQARSFWLACSGRKPSTGTLTPAKNIGLLLCLPLNRMWWKADNLEKCVQKDNFYHHNLCRKCGHILGFLLQRESLEASAYFLVGCCLVDSFIKTWFFF